MKLTSEQFDEIMDIRDRPNDLREGQYMMGRLFKICPQVYNLIVGSKYDPFYLDERIPEFIQQLASYINVYPELIKQKTPTTCGQCVIAMVLATTIEKAIELVGHDNITSDEEMLKALAKNVIEIGVPPEGSIAIQKHKDPNGSREHWTLWWLDKTLDPAEIGTRLWPVYKYILIMEPFGGIF